MEIKVKKRNKLLELEDLFFDDTEEDTGEDREENGEVNSFAPTQDVQPDQELPGIIGVFSRNITIVDNDEYTSFLIATLRDFLEMNQDNTLGSNDDPSNDFSVTALGTDTEESNNSPA